MKERLTPDSPNWPTIPLGCIVNIKTGVSVPYCSQPIPEKLFEAILQDAAEWMGLTLRKR